VLQSGGLVVVGGGFVGLVAGIVSCPLTPASGSVVVGAAEVEGASCPALATSGAVVAGIEVVEAVAGPTGTTVGPATATDGAVVVAPGVVESNTSGGALEPQAARQMIAPASVR
jgi:hypothetical protein